SSECYFEKFAALAVRPDRDRWSHARVWGGPTPRWPRFEIVGWPSMGERQATRSLTRLLAVTARSLPNPPGTASRHPALRLSQTLTQVLWHNACLLDYGFPDASGRFRLRCT